MGPVLQLIILGFLYFIFACILGLILVSIAKLVLLVKRRKAISISQFFWFPMSLAPYFLLAIFVNVIVCEFFRGVDSPFTDYWSLPVGRGLALGAIDVPDKWSLWPSRSGGEAIISDIVLVGVSNEAIYGQTGFGEYFIYKLDSNKKLSVLSKAEYESEIKLIEGSIPTLQHPSEYYYKSRNFGDLVTLLIVLVYPLYRFCRICVTFWRKINVDSGGHVGSRREGGKLE